MSECSASMPHLADTFAVGDGGVRRPVSRAGATAASHLEGRLRECAPSGGALDRADALEVWSGLTSGKWSLVDLRDEAAVRHLVARRADVVAPRSLLTSRQRQVLACASLGWSNKTISYDLGVSATTVSTHLLSAARRLGVRSRVEALQMFRATPSKEGSRGGLGASVPEPPEGLSVSALAEPEGGVLVLVAFPRRSRVGLTSAEVAILIGVLKGASDSDIAARRGTAVRTVSNQVSGLLAKLRVGSRAELASRWLELLAHEAST